MKFTSFVLLAILILSCGEKPKSADPGNKPFIQTFGKPEKTDIGATGFTIELPSTHTLEERKGADFLVYYITSKDTTYNKGGAGIYFGSHPDEHESPSMMSKNETFGITFGKASRTVTYNTPTYTWTETVVDEELNKKIQFWYYATDLVELFNLEKMMGTLQRKN
jgi:hypothetical protein